MTTSKRSDASPSPPELAQGFSVRRVERAVAIAHEAPARAVVVLTKADLCNDVKAHVHEVTRAQNARRRSITLAAWQASRRKR